MNSIKLVGVVLIVLGALGLVYGGFSYTQDTTALKVGPLEMTVQEKKTVNVPMWVGIGAMVVGGVLLAMGGKKS
jgi:TRAP-type C4-dicarboxylate transport system permease small subunit